MCPFLAGTINVQCKTLPAMVIIETCHNRAIIRLKHPGMMSQHMKDNCLKVAWLHNRLHE